MSNGAAIIASNTHGLDYIALAAINAKLIRKHLQIPICLLTPDLEDHPEFDVVIKIPDKQGSNRSMLKGTEIITYEWKNDHRIDAYEHTPWDRTLLVDADYIVSSDMLRPFLFSDQPFILMDSVYDVTGRHSFDHMKYLPNKSLKQAWATVMSFDKKAKFVFEVANMVRENYAYYAAMFNWPARPFRNDFAFTVAGHLLNLPRLPIRMPQLPADAFFECDKNGFKIKHGNNVLRWRSDLHVLNKTLAYDPSVLEPLCG